MDLLPLKLIWSQDIPNNLEFKRRELVLELPEKQTAIIHDHLNLVARGFRLFGQRGSAGD